MQEGLVSIITPCYNGEKYISRFLDSILAQTYKNIELIVVDDGSKDKTEQIIKSFEEKFVQRGYNLIYLRQDNAGQSEAINKGLKIFKGEYLSWLDSDDFLPPRAIELKVKFMQANPKFGTVISKVQVVKEGNLKKISIQERKKPKGKDNIFFDLITGHNSFISCGAFFVRSTYFRRAMPNPLQIAAPREIGQNFQLILPIIYKYPVGYLDEICYYYVVRGDSHSHNKLTYNEMCHKLKITEEILNLITTPLTNDIEQRKEIDIAIKYRLIHTKLINILNTKNKSELLDVISEKKKYNFNNSELNMIITRIKYPFFDYLYKSFLVLKSKILY